MRDWKKWVTLLAPTMGLIILACAPVASPIPTPTPASTPTGPRGPARTLPYAPSVTPTSIPSPTPVSAPARAPIITEAQAIEMGTFMTRFGGPEVSGSQQVRNPEARLMTLAEFEDRFSGYQSAGDRSRPVWVVTVEGEWSDAGIVPPEYRRKYGYGNAVIDAHTGESISGGTRFEPFRLEEAERLDPASFPTYPLDVPLSYAKEVVRFPVSEPTYLPEGFALRRVVMDFANPLPEVLEGIWFGVQMVVLDYAAKDGKTLQFATYSGGLFNEVEGAEKVTVAGQEGWQQGNPDGPNWLAWTAIYPDPRSEFPGSVVYTSYVLRSQDGSMPLDALHRVAESLQPGQSPLPTPTPAATPTPPNWPVPSPTLTPTPTPVSSLISETEAVSRAIEHAQFCGLKGDPTGYVAQRMTLGEYDSLIDAGGPEPDKPVWVVSLRGEIEWRCSGPPSGPIALYVLVVDAETGNVTATSTYRHIEDSPFAVPSDQPPLPTPTPAPTPGGAPALALSWVDDVANLASYPDVVAVILGRVVGKVGENRTPIEGGVAEWVRYERWQVEVERYLVDPQPYPKVTLQFIEGFIQPDGSWLPARFPVSLDPGIRAVFFLTKSLGTAHPALEEGTFTAFLAPGGGGIREVRDGQVSTIRRGQGGWEPLEEFVMRVVQAAKEAGKSVGPDKRP